MATTPEGTPYVESSDLVANYPAASLALANRVDLVGVLPFATSAARATAIPSPTDGQYSYLQDTNLTQFWNGSAWQTAGLTPGYTMVAPTTIANTGGSAALSGNSVTLTGVTNVSLNGVFTSTYENYQIIIKVIGTTVDNFNLRLRASGTDASGSDYRVADLGATTTTGTTSYRPGAVATVFPSPGHIEVYSPQLAVRTGFTSHVSVGASGGVTGYVVVGNHDLATAYDGFTIIAAGGNITGTIRVYGLQNS